VDQWNVPPKLANSGNAARRREAPATLEWLGSQRDANSKFVVESSDDLEEVRRIAGQCGEPPQRVLLMPHGTTAAKLGEPIRVACTGVS